MTTRAGRGWLFVVTILAGSFLLFLVQPMIARMALPRLGGAPAVWNSAMLVYQGLLLGGYAYAHYLGRFAPRVQASIHLAVFAVAALWLPIGLVAMTPSADAAPVLWVPWLLGLSIGPLFFVVAAQAPLMQRWFNIASDGRDPYALYAASNVGSFAGLIAYPLLVEPRLALAGQSWLWTAGYALLALLVAGCAWLLPRDRGSAPAAVTSPTPGARRVAYWIALALVPSGLMLATSTFLTTDIVAMPLLWVIPLGLYLLSFTVAFASNRFLADLITRLAPLSILTLGGVMISGNQEWPFLSAGIALLLLFVIAVALHTALYRARPEPDRLTGFYLAMSVGGALGGVFAALIAPLVFDWTYEYPLLILAAGLLVPQDFLVPPLARLWRGDAQRVRILTLAVALIVVAVTWVGLTNPGEFLGDRNEGIAFLVIAAIGIVTIGMRVPFAMALAASLFLFGGWRALQLSLEGDARTRSYFGVYTVREDPGMRTLAHGTTVHGIQLTGSPTRERQQTSYYVPGSGVGRAMQALPALYGPAARVGVVGLGTGTLACYAKPGQDWRFYEIDPTVIRLARDTRQFSFLSNCLPRLRIELGDARLSLAATQTDGLDLLALDAFSSDAVPMHLMTTEAFADYARVLGARGVLLVHISNRYLELEPVVSAAAEAGGWHGAVMDFSPGGKLGTNGAASASLWVALSKDPGVLDLLQARDRAWKTLPAYPTFTPWTDDFATILPLVKAINAPPPSELVVRAPVKRP